MLYYTHNVVGAVNLIEAMRKHNVKNVRADKLASKQLVGLTCSGVASIASLDGIHIVCCRAAVNLFGSGAADGVFQFMHGVRQSAVRSHR